MQGDSSTTDYRIFIQDKGKHIKTWHFAHYLKAQVCSQCSNAEVLHRWQKCLCLA